MSRNPKWTREELILALDLYYKIPASKFVSTNPQIITLSAFLKKLSAYPNPPELDRYRNPNSVAKKLSNFIRLDKQQKHKGLSHGGKQEEEIWNEFQNKKSLLIEEAEKIKQKIIK